MYQGPSSRRRRSSTPPFREGRYLGHLEAIYSGGKVNSEWHRGHKRIWRGPALDQLSLHSGEELNIGRLTEHWLETLTPDLRYRVKQRSEWAFGDPTISATHLRLYSVQYDEDGEIDPLIFAEDLSSNGTYHNNVHMGRGHKPVLLCPGDTLRLSDKITLVWMSKPLESKEKVFSKDQLREIETFKASFEVSTKVVGAGGFGQVVLAVKKSNAKQVACKVIDMTEFRKQERKRREARYPQDKLEDAEVIHAVVEGLEKVIVDKYNEMDILRDLEHPNIVRLEKVYHTTGAIYIFQEFLAGGDLHSYLNDHGGSVSEAEAGLIIRQVLEAVSYLHDNEVVHRDIKPENLLVANRGEAPRIVLTDFGVAKRLAPSSSSPLRRMTSLAGTYGWAAPEMMDTNRQRLKKPYTEAVDMWAIGILTYTLLVGFNPFDCLDDCASDKADKAKAGLDNYEEVARTIWDRASDAGVTISHRNRGFVRNLLVIDDSRRMTAKQSLAHDWFQNSRVKHAWDRAYALATQGWQPHRPGSGLVEQIHLPKQIRVHRGRRRPEYAARASSQRRANSPWPAGAAVGNPLHQTMRYLYRGSSAGKDGSTRHRESFSNDGSRSPRKRSRDLAEEEPKKRPRLSQVAGRRRSSSGLPSSSLSDSAVSRIASMSPTAIHQIWAKEHRQSKEREEKVCPRTAAERSRARTASMGGQSAAGSIMRPSTGKTTDSYEAPEDFASPDYGSRGSNSVSPKEESPLSIKSVPGHSLRRPSVKKGLREIRIKIQQIPASETQEIYEIPSDEEVHIAEMHFPRPSLSSTVARSGRTSLSAAEIKLASESPSNSLKKHGRGSASTKSILWDKAGGTKPSARPTKKLPI